VFRHGTVSVIMVVVLALAGCGTAGRPPAAADSTGSSTGASLPGVAGVDATDVMFVQMMLPHHRQGIQMVRMAKDREPRDEVRILAAAIDTTQSAEVDMMMGWLRTWQQPETPADPHAHDAHGGVPATSLAAIAALQQATGADFDRRFLDTMIAHQDDAIQLARMELATGLDPGTKDFARRIDQSRTAEIKQMLRLRGP
jgi:uncharacterized protein (DUF305 family)